MSLIALGTSAGELELMKINLNKRRLEPIADVVKFRTGSVLSMRRLKF